MLFLVFFQFGLFKIYNFNLAIEVLLDSIVFFNLSFELFCFLIYSMLLLLDAIFAFAHFSVSFENLSFVFGSRFRGLKGGLAAFAGLVGPPMVLVMLLAALYAHYGDIPALRRILAGISCAAIGLLVATVFRMMMPLLQRRDVAAFILMVAVFAAIGLARLPLQAVLLVAIPISLAITFFKRRIST